MAGRPATIGATATIQLRLSPEQKAAWEAKATAARRTLSDWIRITCDDAPAITQPPSPRKKARP